MSEEFFFSLTPDVVLRSVEESGLVCTGRCMALNSYENRVYDVEIENDEGRPERRIAKFYRPGRWTREQILEEHGFIADLVEDGVRRCVAEARLSMRKIDGVGVGIPGVIDGQAGVSHWSPILGPETVPFAQELQKRLGALADALGRKGEILVG